MQHLCCTAGRCTKMAEGEGFEPSRRLSRLAVFKTAAFNRSATPPWVLHHHTPNGASSEQATPYSRSGSSMKGDDSHVFNAALIYPGTLIAIHNHYLLVEIAALHERSCLLGAFAGVIDRER